MLNEEKYLTSLCQKAAADVPGNTVALVTDPDSIGEFERSQGLSIGLIDNQPYYDFRMDVYRNPKGQTFRYCSIDYSRQGAAILVVFRKGRERFYLLNRQYRPFLQKTVWEIPRGFANPEDGGAFDTAIRELAEETGIKTAEQANRIVRKLGTVHPDSGLSNNTVGLFAAEFELGECAEIGVRDAEESILGHRIVSEEKLRWMILNDEMTDGFTLAAFTKYMTAQAGEPAEK